MTTDLHLEALPENDEAILAALKEAHLPSLLCALAHWSGDLSLLEPELVPETGFAVAEPYSEGQAQRAEAIAFETLRRMRDSRTPVPPPPDAHALGRMLEHLTAGGVTDAYLPLLVEELGIENPDPRAPDWCKPELAPDREFRVAVVGAGMSGLLAAYRLAQAGVPCVVIEKNEDVGGTWLENRYPGCRVDVPNAFYGYSHVDKLDWPNFFSTRDVLLDYFRTCAERFGVRENIRFGTEVLGADYDETQGRWRLQLRRLSDGAQELLEADALISAVGQLNRPRIPDLPGRERFAGPCFHSAAWDEGVKLRGKRVGVIGTGASAAQFVPEIAREAASLTIFQRTPNWLMPTPNYHEKLPEGLSWLFRRVPYYSRWFRFSVFWRMADGLLPMVRVEEGWRGPANAVGEANELLRTSLEAYMREKLEHAPELLAQVLPDYPPASKRILVDNGSWFDALLRDNVELVSSGIREITERGLVDESGRAHEFDVLIFATGFRASDFLVPMKIRGLGGVDLHEHWAGDARAYLGITVPGFPNFFCLYGPNTNIVVNGSITYFSECEVRYLVGCLRMLFERGAAAIDCRREVHDAYNARIDAENSKTAWGVATVNTWYQNAKGRVAQNWPGTLLEYWQQTLRPDPDDYHFLSCTASTGERRA